MRLAQHLKIKNIRYANSNKKMVMAAKQTPLTLFSKGSDPLTLLWCQNSSCRIGI